MEIYFGSFKHIVYIAAMKATTHEPVHVRIPADLKKTIQERAKKEGRTFSNMLIFLLKKALSNNNDNKSITTH